MKSWNVLKCNLKSYFIVIEQRKYLYWVGVKKKKKIKKKDGENCFKYLEGHPLVLRSRRSINELRFFAPQQIELEVLDKLHTDVIG